MPYIQNYIGLTGTTSPAPPTGALLVNNLTGIEISPITDHADDVAGLNALWNKVLLNSEQEIERLVREAISQDVQFEEVIAKSKYPVAVWDETFTKTNSGANYSGTRIRTREVYCGVLSIKEIRFQLRTAATPVAKIINLATGEVLHTITASAEMTAGLKTMAIDKEIDLSGFGNDFAVVIDSENLSLLELPEGNNYEAINDIDIYVQHGYIPKSSGLTRVDFTEEVRFVYTDFSVKADFTTVCEKNIDLLKEASQHICGFYILQESLSTQTFSLWSNTNRMEREDNAGKLHAKAKQYIMNVRKSLLKRLADFASVQKSEYDQVKGNVVGSFI